MKVQRKVTYLSPYILSVTGLAAKWVPSPLQHITTMDWYSKMNVFKNLN